MIKPPLLFRVLVMLAWILAVAPTSPYQREELIRRLTTVASRKEALADLLAQRAQLESAGNTADLIEVNNQIVQLQLQSWELDAAATEAQHSLTLAEQLGSQNGSLLVDTL